MGKLADIIDNYKDVVSALVKSGKLSTSVLHEKAIYDKFQTTSGPRMCRYSQTADDMKVTEIAVRRAVASMEKNYK